MKTATTIENWAEGTTPQILKNVHQNTTNIAIYNRDIGLLEKEIDSLAKRAIKCNATGNIDLILDEVQKILGPNRHRMLLEDINSLLHLFKEVTKTDNFRLLLATINSNMCRKFHIDNNTLRMLCTYSGPGTLWLTDYNMNRNALGTCGGNQAIVRDTSNIKQAKTESVLILKGAKYPKEGTKAVVHRSPTIEESGDKRLLLRIDAC